MNWKQKIKLRAEQARNAIERAQNKARINRHLREKKDKEQRWANVEKMKRETKLLKAEHRARKDYEKYHPRPSGVSSFDVGFGLGIGEPQRRTTQKRKSKKKGKRRRSSYSNGGLFDGL